MMAYVVPQALIIFWWWLRHWMGDLEPICLLSILFKWYFLFRRISPFMSSRNPFRNWTYLLFSSSVQCSELNFLVFLEKSSSPYLLLRGLKNQGLTFSKEKAFQVSPTRQGLQAQELAQERTQLSWLMVVLYYIIQLNYRVTMTTPILISCPEVKVQSYKLY